MVVSSSHGRQHYLFRRPPVVAADDGVGPGEPVECLERERCDPPRGMPVAAERAVVGSIAFRRSGDLSFGTFEDAQVLKKFGDAPGDLSAL